MLRLLSRARGRDDAQRQASDKLKALLRSHLGLGEEDGLAVNEIACADIGCADIETVVLVMRKGSKTEALKVGKPMNEVDELDVELLAFTDRNR